MMGKGPGEGYGAAKDEVLALRPKWRCKAQKWGDQVWGYQVFDEDGEKLPYGEEGTGAERYGFGRQPRDAWSSALDYVRTFTESSK